MTLFTLIYKKTIAMNLVSVYKKIELNSIPLGLNYNIKYVYATQLLAL